MAYLESSPLWAQRRFLVKDPTTTRCREANEHAMHPAARNALKRKKQHEHSLEQTNGQITMLEQQIYSIESANINQETLVAMKNASEAMKKIHGKMTMEDVDATMCVALSYQTPPPSTPIISSTKFQKLANHPSTSQGTSPRAARTHPRNRQVNHLHAHRRHRRRG